MPYSLFSISIERAIPPALFCFLGDVLFFTFLSSFYHTSIRCQHFFQTFSRRYLASRLVFVRLVSVRLVPLVSALVGTCRQVDLPLSRPRRSSLSAPA